MLRHFLLVTALTVLLPLSACSTLTTGIVPVANEPLGSQGAAQAPGNEESELQVLLVAAPRYSLLYPAQFCEALPLELVVAFVETAFDHIEATMGEFDQQILIGVVNRIVSLDSDFPENLTIAGVTFERDGQIHVVVALPAAAGVNTFAHELCHARLRDLGITPPRWLEEGMAHYCETPDGFNFEMFHLLEQNGVLSLDELSTSSAVDEQEMQRRATGWAVVYYLIKVEEHTLEEVAQAAALPEIDVAVAAVKQAANEIADEIAASLKEEDERSSKQ